MVWIWNYLIEFQEFVINTHLIKKNVWLLYCWPKTPSGFRNCVDSQLKMAVSQNYMNEWRTGSDPEMYEANFSLNPNLALYAEVTSQKRWLYHDPKGPSLWHEPTNENGETISFLLFDFSWKTLSLSAVFQNCCVRNLYLLKSVTQLSMSKFGMVQGCEDICMIRLLWRVWKC